MRSHREYKEKQRPRYMPIYCDESGGIGRGVMTMAAVLIDEDKAELLLSRFREVTGLKGELKGSRIDLAERALVFELFEQSGGRAVVSIALSALKPSEGQDRGQHDIHIYAQLMNDSIGALLPASGGCANVVMDTGRYGEDILSRVRADIAALVGPWNAARMEESHQLAGLQIADVIANSFFNRALVTPRQARLAAIVQPFLSNGRIELRVLRDDD
jgi:Protein of unknown function (DUF3800)